VRAGARQSCPLASGPRDAQLQTGVPHTCEAGVEHNTVNTNDYEFIFVEVDIK